MAREYRIDREALQDALGSSVDQNLEADEVLKIVRGKEYTASIKDERFMLNRVKMKVLGFEDEHPGADKLCVWDWKGRETQRPWAIKILHTY